MIHTAHRFTWPVRGSRRIASWLTGVGTPEGKQIAVPIWGGGTIRANWEAVGLALSLWRTGVYEELGSKLVLNLAPGGVFYDVGANIGYYTVLAGVGGARSVIAVEPFPRNLELLEVNIASNSLTSRTRVLRCAAGAQTGEVALHDGGTHGVGSVSITTAVSDRVVAMAPVKPLDDIVAAESLPDPDLVKFDIEGFESQAVEGFARTLRRSEPILLIEMNDRLLRSAGTSAEHLITLLRSLGYENFVDVGARRPSALVARRTFNAFAYTERRKEQALLALSRV